MQSLYAFKGNANDDFSKDEKFLMHSLESMLDLYFSILALLTELHKKSKRYNENLQKKLLTNEADKTQNTRFEDNLLLNAISGNTSLQNVINSRKLNFWDLDFEYVDILFKAIRKSKLYDDYVNNTEINLNNDKQFIIEVYTQIIAPNDKLFDYFEDKKLTWVDDFPVVNTVLIKILKKIKLTSPESKLIPNLYKDEDDKTFALDLFRKTLLNTSNFTEEISKKTTNWDSDRLANLDGLLLKMAL